MTTVDSLLTEINTFLCSNGLLACENCKIESIDDIDDFLSDMTIIMNKMKVYKQRLLNSENNDDL